MILAMPPAESPTWPPAAGTLIGDRYRITGFLGEGGMGCVCEAEHLLLKEPVAIKFLSPARRTADSTSRFLREAKAAARLRSEHVVRVLDVGAMNGLGPYLVMERLEGEDLSALLAREGQQPVERAISYVLQTCAALAEAHAAEIVHRDVKPANLFATRTRTGQLVLKVLDFGISKMNAMPEQPQVTATTAVFGSPAYMAPEQVRSTKNVDRRADIWSLGVVLYELLAATLPFDHETGPGLLAAVVADPPVPLRERRPDIPAELESIVARCLQKDRAARFQTVGELAAALAPFARAGDLRLVELASTVALPSTPGHPEPATTTVVPARSRHHDTGVGDDGGGARSAWAHTPAATRRGGRRRARVGGSGLRRADRRRAQEPSCRRRGHGLDRCDGRAALARSSSDEPPRDTAASGTSPGIGEGGHR